MSETHILVRLSQKRDEEGGLERQEADCRAYCERLGLPVTEVHREVQSAYKGKKRPILEQTLEASKGGHLVVWKMDRLTRQGVTGLGEILQRLERDGTTLHSVTENIDARTPMGRAVLGVLAGVAEQSSADASLRIKRAFEEQAKAGRRHGGGQNAFGWGPGEPELVQQAAAWVASGGSLNGLCNTWNAQGIKSPTGKQWQRMTLSRILRNEALIGVRVHKQERYRAEWDPILSEAQFSAVGAALAQNKKSPRGTSSLLVGLLVCGKCGGKMGASGATEVSGRYRYTCKKEPGRAGCGASIYRDLCDAEVSRQVIAKWDEWERMAPAPLIDPTVDLGKEREALEVLVHDHYVARILPRELFLPAYQELQNKISELESIPAPVPVTAKDIASKIKASVEKVTVLPALRDGVRTPTDERVAAEFKTAWLWQRVSFVEWKPVQPHSEE